MDSSRKNLYRADDALLKAGGFMLVALVIVMGALFVHFSGQPTPEDWLPGRSRLDDYRFAIFLIVACPIGLLAAGIALRIREKKIVAIWELLRRNIELNVPELLANSDFEFEEIDGAVRCLNNRGLGHYYWDRETGMVQDGRLRSIQLHVDTCDACSASISLKIPIGFQTPPSCPFCSEPVSIELLQKRRFDAIDRLRAENAAPEPADPFAEVTGISMSMPIFFILFLFFWPAAILYVWFKWKQAH